MSKKGKAKSGTWVQRDMLLSRAFWALTGTAKGLLFLFLLKRDMSKQHEVLNKRKITMTYLELENLHGKDQAGITKGGLARGSITRGITDLMAKGFIEVVHRGGAYQKDKTVYGLLDEWRLWVPGQIIRERTPGKRAGYFAIDKKSNHNCGPHTHHHDETVNR